jgi:glycosyltransferase involved in cell wall biosynthesis
MKSPASAGWPSVSVCFPAYNEEATIRDVLQEAHELLSASPLDYEILVCDDGSADDTGRIIDDVAGRLPRLRAIHHERNRGIRHTFERLYAEAAKEFVFLNSTDRQWETSILFDMLPLARDWDVVIASRRQKHYSVTREVVSWGFNLVPRMLFGVRTYDAGAVKLMRREIIARFPAVSQSPFNEAERLIKAARAGYRITEYPVTTNPRRAGRARGVSLAAVTAAVKDVARVWWDLRRAPSPGAADETAGKLNG